MHISHHLRGPSLFVAVALFIFATIPVPGFGQEEQGTTTEPITEELAASTTQEAASTTEPIAEEPAVEESAAEEGDDSETQTITQRIFAPVYTSRWFRRIEKVFSLDSRAVHSCAAESFTVDISGQNGLTTRLLLAGADASIGDIEIGNPPDGFNVTFRRNNDYVLRVFGSDAVDMTVVRRSDAQKGSFNVPILYSKKNGASSVVCQLNLLNR